MPNERCDAAENRRRILAVAKGLLAQNRLDSTSMQEIARAAEVGQGTLYRRFADKGELCEALFAGDLEVFWQNAESYLKGGGADKPALSRLEWLLAEKVRFIDAHLSLFLTSHEVAGTKRYDIFEKAHHVWTLEHVVRLLEEARAGGEAEVADVAFTADAMLASFAPPLLAYQRREQGYSLERVIAGISHVFIGGLKRDAFVSKVDVAGATVNLK